jgi:hypothetical protein
MKFFTLCLRFLGLSILCILTLGIGFLWLIPYWHVTAAKFYEDVAMEKLRASPQNIGKNLPPRCAWSGLSNTVCRIIGDARKYFL